MEPTTHRAIPSRAILDVTSRMGNGVPKPDDWRLAQMDSEARFQTAVHNLERCLTDKITDADVRLTASIAGVDKQVAGIGSSVRGIQALLIPLLVGMCAILWKMFGGA